MLSLNVVLPADHAAARGGPMPAYEWLGRRCEKAMRDLGIDRATATPDRRDAQTLAWACFAGMSPWEVTVDGRKLVGLAQRRRRQGVLVPAGVLLGRRGLATAHLAGWYFPILNNRKPR